MSVWSEFIEQYGLTLRNRFNKHERVDLISDLDKSIKEDEIFSPQAQFYKYLWRSVITELSISGREYQVVRVQS